MLYWLYITNLSWPSALLGPGSWRQWSNLPSLLRTGTKPFLPAASWAMLLGTSHHGLRMTPTAVAESCGVGVDSLPAIARCFQRLTPFSTRVAWKPGTLTMIYFWPRSRGSQRQRSRLSRMRSIVLVSVRGVDDSASFNAAYCGCVGSSPCNAPVMLCW